MTLIRTFRRAMLKVLMCTVASAYNVHSLSCILFGRHAVHAGAVSGIQMCRRHVGLSVTAIRQIIGAGHVVGRPGVKLIALTLAADVTLCEGGARDVIDHGGMHV